MVLLKVAELHLFFCPSADCAILFGARDPTERRLAEAQDQTDDGDDEATKEDEELHWCTSLLTRKDLYFPTVVFFFLSSKVVIFFLFRAGNPVVMTNSHHFEFELNKLGKKNL
jgi:hypothetical protein